MKICIWVFWVCFGQMAWAQNTPAIDPAIVKGKMTETAALFNKTATYHPIEKIYLQLNKPWYKTADTIWFKAYTVAGDHKLTDLSEVAYVALTNERDSVIQRLTLKLHNGMAAGSIAVAQYWPAGIYHIKAWTNWMLNEEPNYLFDRAINIGGLPPVTNSAVPASTTIDIQFLPEGGNMVNGLPGRVAFKAVKADGSPADVNGIITDDAGATVATLQSGHDGMGVFAITPQEGKNYKAKLNTSNPQTVALPQALAQGYNLTVNNHNDSLFVLIAANPQLFKNKAEHGFYLIVQAGGKIINSVFSPLENPVADLAIPAAKLPSGIVRFTLFTETGEPVCERVAFINRADNIPLTVKSGKESYKPGEMINLDINTATNVPGNFSMAVINETLAPADELAEPTIFIQLLLTSELHGVINNPAYYFKDNTEKTRADLDMLMLTQGYRKLEWNKLLDTTNKTSPYFAEEDPGISGSVQTLYGKSAANTALSLFVPTYHIIAAAQTDNAGRFSFGGLNVIDTASVILKASHPGNNKTGNDLNITIDKAANPRTNSATYFAMLPTSVPAMAMQKAYVQQQEYVENTKQLKQVDIKDRNNAGTELAPWVPKLNHSDNINGAGHADQVIMGKDLGDCVRIVDCLVSRITGVSATMTGK